MLTPEFIGMIKNVRESYEIKCRNICKEYKMSQTSLDILLLIADHKLARTAKDISHVIDLKPNLISANVEKLVQCGYLVRHSEKRDRRVVNLESTVDAIEIYEKGKLVQSEYLKELYEGISKEEFEVFVNCLKKINQNALNIMNRK